MAMDCLRPVRRNDFHDNVAGRTGVLAAGALGVSMKLGADVETYGEGEPIDYVYEVVHGAVRSPKILPDGRRQISGFYFAGDIFGLEEADFHRISAEAVVDSTIRVIKRRTLIALARGDRDLTQQLLLMATREIARAHSHALMLVQNAQERLSSFLLQVGGADRDPRPDRAANVTPGYCGPPRSDDRNRVAHLHASGERIGDQARQRPYGGSPRPGGATERTSAPHGPLLVPVCGTGNRWFQQTNSPISNPRT